MPTVATGEPEDAISDDPLVGVEAAEDEPEQDSNADDTPPSDRPTEEDDR